MKKLILFSLLSVGFLLFSQCKSAVRYTPGNLPAEQLHWGYGGGFSGMETAFVLLRNGQIFRRKGAGGILEEVKTVKPRRAKELYSLFDKELKRYDFNRPGNVYSFVQWQEGSNIRRIAWGDDRYPVEQKAKDFFNRINQLVVENN